MTWGLAAILFGALLVYAGITGKSILALLRGDPTKESAAVKGPLLEQRKGG